MKRNIPLHLGVFACLFFVLLLFAALSPRDVPKDPPYETYQFEVRTYFDYGKATAGKEASVLLTNELDSISRLVDSLAYLPEIRAIIVEPSLIASSSLTWESKGGSSVWSKDSENTALAQARANWFLNQIDKQPTWSRHIDIPTEASGKWVRFEEAPAPGVNNPSILTYGRYISDYKKRNGRMPLEDLGRYQFVALKLSVCVLKKSNKT